MGLQSIVNLIIACNIFLIGWDLNLGPMLDMEFLGTKHPLNRLNHSPLTVNKVFVILVLAMQWLMAFML